MKIKNIISLAILSVMTLSACSDIAEDERFIKGELVGGSDETEISYKNVLIEDFTGQNCLNCPLAMEELGKLHVSFGDKVVAVGIYGGPFGKTAAGKYYPLTTETGDYYATKLNIQEQPNGYLNRKVLTSNYLTWAGTVADMLSEQTGVSIECENSYDPSTRQASITVKAHSLNSIADTKLQVWLIEDNIVSLQRLPDSSVNKEFTHNHVFRLSVNDRDGEPVTLPQETDMEKTYSLTIDETYKADDLYVVAFIFTPDGVEQVVKAKLTPATAQ